MVYNIGLQRYTNYKIRVWGKDSISLKQNKKNVQPYAVNLRYSRLRLFDLGKFLVWNIRLQRYKRYDDLWRVISSIRGFDLKNSGAYPRIVF